MKSRHAPAWQHLGLALALLAAACAPGCSQAPALAVSDMHHRLDGQICHVDFQVMNPGPKAVKRTLRVKVYNKPRETTMLITLGSADMPVALAAGETRKLETSIRLLETVPGMKVPISGIMVEEK